jgi:hypothetical protein
MRTLRFAGLTVVILSIFGLVPAAAQARVLVNERLTVPDQAGGTVFNPCTGEVVTFAEGRLHLLVAEQTDANGGIHLTNMVNFAGVKGVGETSGAGYVVPRSNAFKQNIAAADEITVTETFRLIRTGSADDFLFHTTFHLTTNANGDLTAEVVDVRITCSG